LYSADIALFGGSQIDYYLDENNNWSLNIEFLENAIKNSYNKGIKPKIFVVINPNNPTGSLLTEDSIKQVINFAETYNLAIIADEVYQENVYNPGDKFVSFAKVMNNLSSENPLFSLNSTSKGFFGECGFRGGYLEMRNIPKEIMGILLKVRSIGLCANTSGQIMTYLMVHPPCKDDDVYVQYIQERDAILNSLARKVKSLSSGLNKIEGISCSTPSGAMYLFPKLDLPTKKDYEGKNPDFIFCKQLVLEEGIVTVPGSGFGQLPETNHLRMTILPQEKDIPMILERFEQFYTKFIH
ncbi:MAG: aminotransferase class I/II-fold pyridoxal phosphate-dependent enzyme, partial [Candidatus Thorarchaeota archaeon]